MHKRKLRSSLVSSITSAGVDNASADGEDHQKGTGSSTMSSSSPGPASSGSGGGGGCASSAPSRTARSASSSAAADSRHSFQNRKVWCIRLAVITTLLAAATIVAAFIGTYIAADERQNFEVQYRDSVSKVASGFQHRIDTKHDIAKTFSAVITSRYGSVAQAARGMPPLWPNATMPDFQELSEGSLRIADGRALSFNPIITQGVDRLEWEAHAAESAWILGDERLVTAPDPALEFPANRTVSFGIYSRDADRNVVYDPGYAPDSPPRYQNVMVPVWQIAPIVTNEKAVMFNLHSESNRRQALDHMMEHGVPALTAILQLVQDVEIRPSSILFYPVFDTFEKSNNGTQRSSAAEGDEDEDRGEVYQRRRKVPGSVSIVFSWDTLLNKILPDYIKGMICVLHSSTGQMFSYSISGDVVTLLGEGDRHDPAYDRYGHTVQAELLLEGDRKAVTYQLHAYPSAEFEAQYVTNRAAIYSAGAVLIFLFTSALFLLYDYLVEDRQRRTARLARQTGNIVDALFPAAFRERLYSIHNGRQEIEGAAAASVVDADGTSNGSRHSLASRRRRSSASTGSGPGTATLSDKSIVDDATSAGGNSGVGGSIHGIRGARARAIDMRRSIRGAMGLKNALGKFDNPLNPPAHQSGGGYFEDEPIAELFHGTSIMFSDIVGFTKWSSEHTPNQVFRLLEQLFWEFDDIAARLKVFKLGTIGDCYIAVTGIPDPVDDHAALLARFAFEARDKVREVCARLDREDGLDTSALDMRFGIHSGATTAGILRGTKSRFELFGDTINTASRMESTGSPGKIQVSEETAELIRRDGKSRWLLKREVMIEAKGKGQLQTYWVEPDVRRVSFSEKVNNFFVEDSLRDLKECSDAFYQGCHSTIGRHLSQCDEEEKQKENPEEDCLKANLANALGSSNGDDHGGNGDVPEKTSELDDDESDVSKITSTAADDNV